MNIIGKPNEIVITFSEEEIKILNKQKELKLPAEVASTFFNTFIQIFFTMDTQLKKYINEQNKNVE
jgi:hypothetical protein